MSKPDHDPNARVAFVTLYDATDITMMSGTGYHISRGLVRHGIPIDLIGPLRKQHHPINIIRHAFQRTLLGRNDHPQRDSGFLRHFSGQVSERIKRSNKIDIVFASGGLPVSYLETDLPLVVWTDCTFANLLNYYPKYTNLSARTIRDGHAAERSLYARCDRAVFTSRWAMESAVHDYGLDPRRATVISRGANVSAIGSERALRERLGSRPRHRCELLFIGKDWARKGGDIAIETTRELNRRGIGARLTVIGSGGKIAGVDPGQVRLLGCFSKHSPGEAERFVQVIDESDFVIIPTRAEAYGISYLEAAARGVPALGTRTGGVAESIRHGVSGLVLEHADQASAYADEIERLHRDERAYSDLSLSAYRDHTERTSWDVVIPRLIGVLDEARRERGRG